MARNIVQTVKPKRLLLLGIAAGIGKDVKLGDVLISDQIVDYELGKITDKGYLPRWSVYRSDYFMLSGLSSRGLSWLSELRSERPGNQMASPSVHVGVILSGNKVVAYEDTVSALKGYWPYAIGLEMEAAGVAAALHQLPNSPPFVMVKGVCDRADATKNDAWHEYAADAAAALTMQYLRSITIPSVAPVVESQPRDQRMLRVLLATAYSMSELKILASDLDIDWDEIPGQAKSERIVELIGYLRRRSRLGHLLDAVKRDRPALTAGYYE